MIRWLTIFTTSICWVKPSSVQWFHHVTLNLSRKCCGSSLQAQRLHSSVTLNRPAPSTRIQWLGGRTTLKSVLVLLLAGLATLTPGALLLAGMAALTPVAAGAGMVRLAVIAPEDPSHEQSLYRVLPAVELAVHKVTDPVHGTLPNWDIRVDHRDSKCSSTYGPLAAFEFYNNKSASACTTHYNHLG
ncbi:hypothetical protein PR048_003067 [Dryococelus australis]|uniref:Uncharacterized protein n=1 Tax=Dryococelus australis TaxID=614101 RepID=A0ABQ9IM11_9NEOP|nr:hypothetical protein PR048_003067 [Dryococelus australis]